MTVADWLARTATEAGERPAILGVDRPPLSHAALLAEVTAIGAKLRAAGVGAGDPVLIALHDGPEMLVAILAAATVGAAFPIAAHEQPDRLRHYLDELPVRAILGNERTSAILTEPAAERRIPLGRIVPEHGAAAGVFHVSLPPADRDAAPRAPNLEDAAVLVATGGTTAAPKIVSSSHASLYASISRCAEWLRLGPDDRSLSIMPFAHLHSLVRSSLPGLLAGGSVIATPGLDRARVLDWLDAYRPTYITAAPSLYRTLSGVARERGWRAREPSLRFILVGSDRVDGHTVAEARAALGGPAVYQFYGLSEVAPLVATMEVPATDAAEGLVGRVNEPWSLVTVDEAGDRLPSGSEGEIAIRGGFINPLVGRNASAQRKTADGYLLTGDRGRLAADGSLFVSGRVDDRIHRGGEKIDPAIVEAVLTSHPDVAEAAVFGLADSVLGHRVAAVVVPHPGAKLDTIALQTFAGQRLSAYMVPERITVADRLAVNAAGKVSRAALARTVAEPAAETAAPPSMDRPRDLDSVQRALREMFVRRLERENFADSDDFFRLGGDSFGAIEVLMEIEDAFGVNIAPATFNGNATVAGLAALLADRPAAEPKLQLIALSPKGRLPPLFVPYGPEGHAGFASVMSDALGREQPVYAFHAPRGEHEPAELETMEAKAAKMIDMIVAVQPRGPYFLIGYSFGSHLALEIAQQLSARGETIAFLGVIDDSADLEKRNFAAERNPPAAPTTLTANKWALSAAVPKPFPGRIALFRASDPVETYQSDPYAGWGDLALGGVDVMDIAGDHMSVVTAGGFGWGQALSLSLAKARHRVATRGDHLDKEFARAFQKARGATKVSASRHTIDARIAAKRGDLKTEIAEYRRAIALDAQPVWVHYNLAEALLDAGEVFPAMATYEAALALDPWPMSRLVKLAELKAQRQRSADREPLYRMARSLVSEDPDTLRHFAHICSLTGHLAEAESAVRKAIVLEEQTHGTRRFASDLYGYLSDVLAATGRQAEALAPALKAAEILPDDPRTAHRVSRLLGREGRTPPAESTEPPDRVAYGRRR